jgi:Flp pilus assembly protein TadG
MVRRFRIRWRRRAIGDDRGANLVEFALLAVPFLMITLGLVDFGRAIFAYNALAHATREAARVAMVRGSHSGSPITAAQVTTLVQNRAIGLDQSAVVVSTTWDGNTCACTPYNDPGKVIRIVSTYSFQPLTTFAISTPITLRSRAELMIHR